MVTLTHTATSTDTDYDAITIADVTVTVNDNDTAQVMGVMVTPGNKKLRVNWTAVDNATGNHVQWKSGAENYNTTDRQATVTAASHTILGLANGTEYTVQVIAVRTGANDAPPSAEVKGTPVVTPGVTVSIATLTVTEEDATGCQLHGGPRYLADRRCHGHRRRPREHGRDPEPIFPDLYVTELGNCPDGDGDRG